MGVHRILGCKVHTWSKWLSWIFIVAHSILLCKEAIEGHVLWESRPAGVLEVEVPSSSSSNDSIPCKSLHASEVNAGGGEVVTQWKTRVLFLGLQSLENILELIMSILLLLGSMMRENRYLKAWVVFAGLIIFWHITLAIIREAILGDSISEVMSNFAELIFIVSLYGFVMWIVGILVHEINAQQRRARQGSEISKQRVSLKV